MPVTSEEIEREKKRIALLLDINNEILQYTSQLHADGHGGILPQGPQAQRDPADPGSATGEQKQATGDYLKCVQLNKTLLKFL